MDRLRPQRLGIVILVALLMLMAAAHAGTVYRWKDKNGVTHYGDRAASGKADPARTETLRVRSEPNLAVRMRVETQDGAYVVWADNQLAGPIEVLVAAGRSRNIRSEPALPARATVPAQASVIVARIESADPRQAGEFDLRLANAVPGAPTGDLRDVEYRYPLDMGDVRVGQAFGGGFSHNDAPNLYAVDFAAPIGTRVLAARDGIVMQVENDFDRAGLNLERYGNRANLVRILHDDGSMAVYAHLQEQGVMVRMGQHVRAGQLIGLSGNTGFTSGPHLHFVVQANRGMRLESVPFRMFGPQGILRFALPQAL